MKRYEPIWGSKINLENGINIDILWTMEKIESLIRSDRFWRLL